MIKRRTDRLVLEAYPLHTERPEWAAQAPAQIEAAFKRGAHVIGFTELGRDHQDLIHQAEALGKRYGYKIHNGFGDALLAYKGDLPKVVTDTEKEVSRFGHVSVAFDFHGRRVTVFGWHLSTLKNDPHHTIRKAQIASLADAMTKASQGSDVSFFLADTNPHPGLHDPNSEPRATLAAHGIVLVYTELNDFPAGVGVTTIGRAKADASVKALSARIHPPLGSDHHPVTAVYSIARRGLLSRRR